MGHESRFVAAKWPTRIRQTRQGIRQVKAKTKGLRVVQKDKLVIMRDKARLTQEVVAARLGKVQGPSLRTYQRLESGEKTVVTTAEAQLIADCLGCSMGDFSWEMPDETPMPDGSWPPGTCAGIGVERVPFVAGDDETPRQKVCLMFFMQEDDMEKKIQALKHVFSSMGLPFEVKIMVEVKP